MRQSRLGIVGLQVGAWVLCCWLPGCATNPVTGRRELNLMSESQEIALGRDADPQIVATYGLYDDPALAAYVDSIGQALAAVSHRPDLAFTFRVLDSPVINAFALPGGYIYITRGILAHMNDEAELAIVLGHEIGHVTARHGANQYSRATLAGFGLGVGAIFSREVAALGQLAESALGLLFMKYGRDDETQADELGVRYATKGGWDASEGVEFFEVLDRQQQESGQSLPAWLSTHPAPAYRVVRTRELAAQSRTQASYRTGEEAHKAHLQGVVFGDDPRQGFVDGDTFKHPELEFSLRFPSGWSVHNTPSAVLALEPERKARLQLTMGPAEGRTPSAYLRELAQEAQAEVLGLERETIGGYDAALAQLRVPTESGPMLLQLAAIQRQPGGPIFQILGVGAGTFSTWQPTFVRCMRSFAALRERAALAVQPNRVRVVRVQKRESLAQAVGAFTDVPVPLPTLALLNNLRTDTPLEPGFRLKIVRGTFKGSTPP